MTPSGTAPKAAAEGWFVTTHWTVVLTAAGHDTTRARTALADLCQTYWYPLYAYARHRGSSPEDAQDSAQAFFERLLEKKILAQITQEGGKFRSFLLTAFNNFLKDQWKHASAQKRGGGQIIAWDGLSAEARYQLEPVEMETPEQVYERNWALALLGRVMERLRREYTEKGQPGMFEQLKFSLTGERSLAGYAELAHTLGVPQPTVKVLVHRLRRRYRDLVRDEVANTVSDPVEVEEELQHLMRVLSS